MVVVESDHVAEIPRLGLPCRRGGIGCQGNFIVAWLRKKRSVRPVVQHSAFETCLLGFISSKLRRRANDKNSEEDQTSGP